MSLVERTTSVLADTPIEDSSMLEYVYRLRDPRDGSWSHDVIRKVEAAMVTAAEGIPEQELIDEFNELADYHDCGRIDCWDSNAPGMDLEMFLDEVLVAVEQEMA